MKVTAVATELMTTIDGQPARVWHAVTESGVKFIMFVSRVAVPEAEDQAEFERVLDQMPAPKEVSTREVFDARLII